MMKLVELLKHATCDYPNSNETRYVETAKTLIREKGADKSFNDAFESWDDKSKRQWMTLFKEAGCQIFIDYAGDDAVKNGFNKMTVEPRVFDSGRTAVIKFTMPTRRF